MPRSRTAILNLRVDPALKEALRIAAGREHRSVANMVEWLGSIPEQTALSLEDPGGRNRT